MNKFILFLILFFTATMLSAQTTQWRLIWDKNTEPDMSHYEIYRSVGSPNASVKYDGDIGHHDATHFIDDSTMFFIDDDLDKGVQIYYRLKAVDSSGLSSDFSDEVSAAIPLITGTSFTFANQWTAQIGYDSLFVDPDNTYPDMIVTTSNLNNIAVVVNGDYLSVTAVPANFVGIASFTLNVSDQEFFDEQTITVNFTNPKPSKVKSLRITN